MVSGYATVAEETSSGAQRCLDEYPQTKLIEGPTIGEASLPIFQPQIILILKVSNFHRGVYQYYVQHF